MRSFARSAAVVLVILSSPVVRATCGGGGGGGMGGIGPRPASIDQSYPGSNRSAPNPYVVPWRVLKQGDPPLSAPLVLYWFPATAEEMQGGALTVSRALTLDSARCVGMQLVAPTDAATIAKWNVAGKLPAVVIGSGSNEVARLDTAKGEFKVSDVENLLHHELYQREVALVAQLEIAKQKASSGAKDEAITAYQKVWEQRCTAPDLGREAQKALRHLGVTVKDAALRTSDPIETAAMNRRMVEAMSRAFAAELAGHYADARALYRAAATIDPADPVPPRFLGELYRHHTGQWTLARQTFERLLAMQPDPLSRAVALHGLGKMTIHMGDSAGGLQLFEESIAAYPLALTYRNMAVYWNSERNRQRADVYVQKALDLDPKDPYNLIFAATYMADSGRAQEALKIARDHEDILSASYNLAAIYALVGNKGKAMELLKRHFYQYERYDAVRAKEMWEARVDYVFASMKDDPAFLKLTYMAR